MSDIVIVPDPEFVGEFDGLDTRLNAVGVMWYAYVECFCLVDFHELLHRMHPELNEDHVKFAEQVMAEMILSDGV